MKARQTPSIPMCDCRYNWCNHAYKDLTTCSRCPSLLPPPISPWTRQRGPAGGCSVRSERRPRIEVLDGYIAPGMVQPQIEWSQA